MHNAIQFDRLGKNSSSARPRERYAALRDTLVRDYHRAAAPRQRYFQNRPLTWKPRVIFER